jgi:hypothetical protein
VTKPWPTFSSTQVGVAAVEGGGAGLHDAVEADDVVEEAARDEARRDRLEHHEEGVHDDRPEGRAVIEDARRQQREQGQVVERDGGRGGEHDAGVREHRQQGDEHEEIEVHLDLHGPLAEVHEQPAHAHRGDAVDDRDVARVLEGAVRDGRPGEHHHREEQRLPHAGAREPGHQHEHGRVQPEEDERDAVHAREVGALEEGDLSREREISEESLHHWGEAPWVRLHIGSRGGQAGAR